MDYCEKIKKMFSETGIEDYHGNKRNKLRIKYIVARSYLSFLIEQEGMTYKEYFNIYDNLSPGKQISDKISKKFTGFSNIWDGAGVFSKNPSKDWKEDPEEDIRIKGIPELPDELRENMWSILSTQMEGWIHVYNQAPAIQFDNRDRDVKYGIDRDLQSCETVECKKLLLQKEYKIRLSTDFKYLPKILKKLNTIPSFRKHVFSFKVPLSVCQTRDKKRPKGSIIMYLSVGDTLDKSVDIAVGLLKDIVYSFKDTYKKYGKNFRPMYNEKINDLVFYSGGGTDNKIAFPFLVDVDKKHFQGQTKLKPIVCTGVLERYCSHDKKSKVETVFKPRRSKRIAKMKHSFRR